MSHEQIEQTAVNAALEAGKLIVEKSGKAAAPTRKSNDYDLVTEVDKACEEIITGFVHREFPEHQILGEEGVAPGSEASAKAVAEMKDADFLWIIDPIDGTTNFIHGLPLSVVSIGVAEKGKLVVGVIYDPYRQELFVARRGEGAYLNGNRITISKETTIQESVLATGFPPSLSVRNLTVKGLEQLSTSVRGVRNLGSAALHLAYVAAGRMSGFWHIDLNAWDVSAGSLLVEEAGGRITDTRGNPYRLETRNILATNGHIHGQLLKFLTDYQVTGFEQ